MLPKELKLDPKEIQRISRFGKKFSNDFFDIRVWFDDSLKNSEYAISISTKVDKRATVRNRIKRTIRSAIVSISSKNPKNAKYLIIVKNPALAEMKSGQIEEILTKII